MQNRSDPTAYENGRFIHEAYQQKLWAIRNQDRLTPEEKAWVIKYYGNIFSSKSE